MKKISLVLVLIGVVFISAYIYLRYSVSTPGFQPAASQEIKAETKKAETPLDLRPLLVQKLQQIVKQGSAGLYNLSVHEVEPDVLNSSVLIRNVELIPDTAVLAHLRKLNQAPTDIFKVKLASLKIEGLDLTDLLNKKVLDLQTIRIKDPLIEVYRGEKKQKPSNDNTLYQRLKDKLEHLAVDNIIIEGGSLVNHNLSEKKTSKLNQISLHLSDLLIDSSTQYDTRRFFFAKGAQLTIKDYTTASSDGLYDLRIGSISVLATQSVVTAKDLVVQPRLGKKEFGQKLKVMKERYQLSIPSIRFKNMDWWSLANEEKIFADEASIDNARFRIYLDRSLPPGKPKIGSFPSQLVMKLPVKISIAKLNCKNLDLLYEEYNPFSGQTGKVHITRLQGQVKNLTNLPSAVKNGSKMTVKARGRFLDKIPMSLALSFDLSRYKTGAFSADLSANSFDGALITPVTEPLGLFRLKSGTINSMTAHVDGTDAKATGKVLLLYKDLHVDPLEKDKQKPGELNKKHVTGFIANSFILKDENPAGKEVPRNPDAVFIRDPHGSFFNLIWKTTLVGILKTTGAPEKLAKPKLYRGE